MQCELRTLVAAGSSCGMLQEPAAACLVGVHFGLPVVHKGPAHAVSAEGGGLREARLPAPVNGA